MSLGKRCSLASSWESTMSFQDSPFLERENWGASGRERQGQAHPGPWAGGHLEGEGPWCGLGSLGRGREGLAASGGKRHPRGTRPAGEELQNGARLTRG